MDATKDTAKADQPRQEDAREAASGADEQARSRTYLDLWERHLVHAALNGPAPEGRSPAR